MRCTGNDPFRLEQTIWIGCYNFQFIEQYKGRVARPSFVLSPLLMPLGAGLCLLRLVGAECNINIFAYLLKLAHFGAGFFQFSIVTIPLPFEGGVLLFPFRNRQGLYSFRQLRMEIAACRFP